MVATVDLHSKVLDFELYILSNSAAQSTAQQQQLVEHVTSRVHKAELIMM